MRRAKKDEGVPPFEGEVRNWGVGYFRKNKWKVASMYDDSDIQQDVFMIYWRTKRNYPHITSRSEFMRLFKGALRMRVYGKATQCFPNPYNVGAENRCYSLTSAVDGRDLTDELLGGVYSSVAAEAEDYLMLLQKLPFELQEAFIVLIREFLGLENVSLVGSIRLDGTRRTVPFETALAKRIGSPNKRDLLSRIARELGIVEERKEV